MFRFFHYTELFALEYKITSLYKTKIKKMQNLCHTGLVTEVQDIIIGTGQFPNNLAIIFTFGQPAVTRESKCFVKEFIFYINVF